MIIEESITASFLPMARKHVQRCMEENTKGTKNRNATMNQWTATPEECFLQVVNHKQSEDRVPILPSMAPPVLSTMIGQPDYVPTHRSLLVDEAESALQQWADSQDLSLSFIKKNYKLFGLDNPEEVVNNAQDDMEEESDKKRKIVAVQPQTINTLLNGVSFISSLTDERSIRSFQKCQFVAALFPGRANPVFRTIVQQPYVERGTCKILLAEGLPSLPVRRQRDSGGLYWLQDHTCWSVDQEAPW